MKPTLLFVSPRFLFPMDQGGKIRSANTLRGMKGGAFEIVLASPLPDDGVNYDAEIAQICDRFVGWTAPKMSTAAKVLGLANSIPVPVLSDRSADGMAVIAAELAHKPSVLVIDFPHGHVLKPASVPPGTATVIYTHNVEAEIFARHAEIARGPMRLVWRNQTGKMRRFEGDALRSYDSVVAVSVRDAEALGRDYGLKSVHPVDTGVDLDFYPFTNPSKPPTDGGRVVFCGAMDSRSNIDGVTWLAEEIWPLILAVRPKAEAVIVGRNPPPDLVAKLSSPGHNISFTGFVDDIRPHVSGADVSVIPLRVGSGTRIKAFEAMALGRPVVSTRVGIEGLDITPGEHFLQADTAAHFAASVLALLDDASRATTMAQVARNRLEERFSWRHVSRQFEAICIAARRSAQGR